MIFLCAAARAGDLHTDEFTATVVAVARVDTYTFPDDLARFADPDAPPRTGGPACAITVSVDHAYFRAPETFYASVDACGRVTEGASVTVQYLGLADYFQFVAVRVGGEWAALPRMRETAATGPMARCLGGTDGCAPIVAPPL